MLLKSLKYKLNSLLNYNGSLVFSFFPFLCYMFSEVVIAVFLICISIQLGYVLYFFTHIFSIPKANTTYTPVQKVSVIICAKNEADHLQQHLPQILSQRYTNDAGNALYEVIVVNDASDDDTEQVLQQLQQQYSHLRTITISKDEPRSFKGKKFALNRAVELAQNEILLMTDADCTPNSNDWLATMVAPFYRDKELVLGYGAYKTQYSILNSFVRWETIHSFLQYSTYALAGKPYMAVGRNMACTKELFLKAQASKDWNKLPSGDDDLLVQAAGNRKNVAVVADKASFTKTDAPNELAAWYRQKSRHLSTGKYYGIVTKMLLAVYGMTHALTWVSFFILLFTPAWDLALGVMAMRSVVYWLVWWQTACILGEKKLIRFFPLFDIGWMLYNFAFSPYIFWKNKQQWT